MGLSKISKIFDKEMAINLGAGAGLGAIGGYAITDKDEDKKEKLKNVLKGAAIGSIALGAAELENRFDKAGGARMAAESPAAKNRFHRDFNGLSDIEAKKRYRDLARKHHPDVGGDNETMAELNSAYEKFKKRNSK